MLRTKNKTWGTQDNIFSNPVVHIHGNQQGKKHWQRLTDEERRNVDALRMVEAVLMLHFKTCFAMKL